MGFFDEKVARWGEKPQPSVSSTQWRFGKKPTIWLFRQGVFRSKSSLEKRNRLWEKRTPADSPC